MPNAMGCSPPNSLLGVSVSPLDAPMSHFFILHQVDNGWVSGSILHTLSWPGSAWGEEGMQ